MKVDLDQILALAGDLADERNRDRFRRFLLESAKDADAILELLASAALVFDLEHDIALRDLVWALGVPLGFSPGPGFDGEWISPSGVHLLLEIVRKGETPDLAAVARRIERIESAASAPPAGEAGDPTAGVEGEGRREGAEAAEREGEGGEELSALGLLVADDSEVLRVEEAILEGDEAGQLRTISTSALLSIAKMRRDYRLTHGDVLLLLLTSGPSVDPIIDLLARVVSRCEEETPTLEEIAQILGPLGRGGEAGPEEALADLIDQSRYYAYGGRGGGRREKGR